MKENINKVKDNTIMLYILQISKYAFPLITFPYLTRVLQPENYGIMTFATGVMVYFQLLIDFGFLQSATKDCSLFRDNKSKLSQILASAVQAKLFLGILGLIILVFLVYLFDTFQGRGTYIVLAYIPVFLSAFSIDFLFRGLEIMKIITLRTIVGRIFYTILIFLFVHTPEHYLMIPIISSFGELIILIWGWIYVINNLEIRPKFASLLETMLALRDSSLFFLSRIATTAYTSTNIVILGLIYNNTMLAQFGVANVLINNIKSFFSPIADSLYPYMIQNKNYALIKKILLVLMPLIFLGTVILYFFAKPIITLLSGEFYMDAIPVFRALLPTVFLTLPIYLLGFPVLGAMNRMKDANFSVIYGALYHLIGITILYYLGKCTLISIAILTCSTEFVILIYRAICVWKAKHI